MTAGILHTISILYATGETTHVPCLETEEECKKGAHSSYEEQPDGLEMTHRLLRNDDADLADCIVPSGDRVRMARQELEDMLRTRTWRFTEERDSREVLQRLEKGI